MPTLRLLLALAAVPFLAAAQDAPPRPPGPIIRATGEAAVSAKPDQARISIGVTTRAATAVDAVRQNADETTRVLDQLKKLVGPKDRLTTTNYSVNPAYRYPQNSSPVLTGYETNNTVQVTLNDLTEVGKVIDAAAGSGANAFGGIQFTLRNDEEIRAQAIAEATAVARKNAEAMAHALGLHVVGVVSAETNDVPNIRPMVMGRSMMAGSAAAPTPVESGTLDVRASVVVALRVAP